MKQIKRIHDGYVYIWEEADPNSLVMLKQKIKAFQYYQTYAIWVTEDKRANDIKLTLDNHKVHATIIPTLNEAKDLIEFEYENFYNSNTKV